MPPTSYRRPRGRSRRPAASRARAPPSRRRRASRRATCRGAGARPRHPAPCRRAAAARHSKGNETPSGQVADTQFNYCQAPTRSGTIRSLFATCAVSSRTPRYLDDAIQSSCSAGAPCSSGATNSVIPSLAVRQPSHTRAPGVQRARASSPLTRRRARATQPTKRLPLVGWSGPENLVHAHRNVIERISEKVTPHASRDIPWPRYTEWLGVRG